MTRHTASLLRVVLPVVLILTSRQAVSEDRPPFQPRVLMSPRRAIVSAPVLKAADVQQQVLDSELVLGVVVNGKSRAYPINMLTGPSREIIIDQLGGSAIAASW